MKSGKGYRSAPLSFTRKMVIASANANKKNAIHCITEIDISRPRQLIKNIYEKSGEKLSFTGVIVKSFAEAIKLHPELNSFIKRRRLIVLDDINISVLIEREIDGQKVPEPLGIQKIQEKSLKQVHNEIRKAQNNTRNEFGNVSNASWIRFIPGFLLRLFVKIADKNIKLAKRYGKIAVTAVGMFSKEATWFIPHGTATVLLTIGSMNKKMSKQKKVMKKKNFYVLLHLLIMKSWMEHQQPDLCKVFQ